MTTPNARIRRTPFRPTDAPHAVVVQLGIPTDNHKMQPPLIGQDVENKPRDDGGMDLVRSGQVSVG